MEPFYIPIAAGLAAGGLGLAIIGAGPFVVTALAS